ncbi:sensor domain-containing diguanylate cyclase [Desulfogranum japonicum]|uniref:sensor domain-containing diguanylate cyclase n=1 Tax=Desulfogranum japonicum TaxID=231447 RepID=UPI00041A44FD|nr:GGDEF domain-containing protein [Desulfogranum japonicum]
MKHPPENIQNFIIESKELPTLPVVASKLLTLTAKEDTTLSDIAHLISQDVALSSKVLRVSNSSFYSFPQQISTINQAVSILGTNAVRSLVLSFSFFSMNKKNSISSFDFQKFWEKSLVRAASAKLILEQIEGADTEEIFISGLLQDIGKLIFATTLPEQYARVLERIQQEGDEADEKVIEEEIIGLNHSEAGHMVAKHWGFPERLLYPIRFHHLPKDVSNHDEQLIHNVHAVYLSDLLTQLFYSERPERFHKQFRQDAQKLLGLKAIAVNAILRKVDREIRNSAEYFGVKIGEVKSVAEILQEANLRLSLLNLSYEEMNRELIKAKMALENLTEELGHKNSLLENLANIDGLTEINNHRFFQNFLDKEINRSIRNGKTISILLTDIDHFKKFNDQYGHQVGDFILRDFCRVVKEVIREYDLIARYGGEEFVFVLPETEPEDALLVAEKIRKTVDDYIFDDGAETYHVTISVGVACARPSGDGFKKNEFIGLADEALYDAKNSGRNKVAMYNPRKKKKWFQF